MAETKVPKRILTALINSVSAGVVPRVGAPYIAIGRNDEIAALLSDFENVNDGGAAMRFIIGKYGSGKSFLIQLMRGYAIERDFVTIDADLSPERRICGGKGSGISTYRELIRNMSTKASPDGGALPQMIAKWLSGLKTEIAAEGVLPGNSEFDRQLSAKIFNIANELENEVGGFDFAAVLNCIFTAYQTENEELKSAAFRWLRGEYSTKSEAKAALPVGGIIDDSSWYDYIKLIAAFVRKIGYRGLIMFVDECVNLYKIPNRISRENNYEMILSMFNDTLQGKAKGLAIIWGGTPQFLEDTRRGLFSYEALRSRLDGGAYTNTGYKNLTGPVIRLRRLSDDELFALIVRLTKLHAQNYAWEPRVTEEESLEFLKRSLSRAGADTMITPREIIRDYINILNILNQNPDVTFAEVIKNTSPSAPSTDADNGKTAVSTGGRCEVSIDDISF